MKTTAIMITALVLALAPYQSQAGDKEWGVVGKVLTGVFALKVIDNIVSPSHTHVVHQPVVVQQPVCTQTVVVQQPVCVTPPPVVVYHHAPSVVVSTPHWQPMYRRPVNMHSHVHHSIHVHGH